MSCEILLETQIVGSEESLNWPAGQVARSFPQAAQP